VVKRNCPLAPRPVNRSTPTLPEAQIWPSRRVSGQRCPATAIVGDLCRSDSPGRHASAVGDAIHGGRAGAAGVFCAPGHQASSSLPTIGFRDLAAARTRPKFWRTVPQVRGRRHAGWPNAPHSLACELAKAHERSHQQVTTGNRPAFPRAVVFNGLNFGALPGDQACLTHVAALLYIRRLDAGIVAP